MRLLLIFSLLCFWLSQPAGAIVDPLAAPNNRFGIHILEPEDIKAAAELVNSQGGDWGYVTLVIRENDRSLEKWQPVFDDLRRRHLIPLVRLATAAENNYWVKPNPDEIGAWVGWLNSLNWVTQNRYVVLFNEPNHSSEWGGSINPAEYASVVRKFHESLKTADPDFFILPAGLDTAAPDSATTMAAVNFWQQMHQADPAVFSLFDGWNSHSYPNPGFAGSPLANGLGTLQSYRAEISFLARLGLPQDLPVFITETGWTHKDGNILGDSDPASPALSEFYLQAFTKVWIEANLVAVTPFILNYSQAPFSQFAWQKPNTSEFYPHYYTVAALPKVAGRPQQVHNSRIETHNLPLSLVDSSVYEFKLNFKNTGQSIWQPTDFSVTVSGNVPENLISVSPLLPTEPGKTAELKLHLETPDAEGFWQIGLQLNFAGEPFGEKLEQTITLVPPPGLIAKVKTLWQKPINSQEFSLLVYDDQKQLQFKTELSITGGQSRLVRLYNLVPDNLYTFILQRPYYRQKQLKAKLAKDLTEISFGWLWPDLKAILFHPFNYFGLRL